MKNLVGFLLIGLDQSAFLFGLIHVFSEYSALVKATIPGSDFLGLDRKSFHYIAMLFYVGGYGLMGGIGVRFYFNPFLSFKFISLGC